MFMFNMFLLYIYIRPENLRIWTSVLACMLFPTMTRKSSLLHTIMIIKWLHPAFLNRIPSISLCFGFCIACSGLMLLPFSSLKPPWLLKSRFGFFNSLLWKWHPFTVVPCSTAKILFCVEELYYIRKTNGSVLFSSSWVPPRPCLQQEIMLPTSRLL